MSKERKRQIESMAHQTLVSHGLLSVPVNPVLVANKLGIRLAHALFSDPKYFGMTVNRGGQPTILVKEGESPYRKRFTVAHEIGHCVLHLGDGADEIVDTDADFFRTPPPENAIWTPERNREWEANVFAAELLMPRDAVKEYWRRIPLEDRTVETLARVFQVSVEAMGFRLSELELLDNE